MSWVNRIVQVRKMYMGNKQITYPYLGNKKLKAVYLGNKMVWGEKNEPHFVDDTIYWNTWLSIYARYYNQENDVVIKQISSAFNLICLDVYEEFSNIIDSINNPVKPLYTSVLSNNYVSIFDADSVVEKDSSILPSVLHFKTYQSLEITLSSKSLYGKKVKFTIDAEVYDLTNGQIFGRKTVATFEDWWPNVGTEHVFYCSNFSIPNDNSGGIPILTSDAEINIQIFITIDRY